MRIIFALCFVILTMDLGWGVGNELWPRNYHYARLNNLSMLSPAFVYSMPVEPMKKGKKELKIIPVKLTYQGSSEREFPYENAETKGLSIGISFLYPFKDWFAVSIMGAYQKNDGTASALSVINNGTAVESHSGTAEGRSSILGVNCIFNLLQAGSTFRLPLLVGLGMANAKAKVTGESTVGQSGVIPLTFSSGHRLQSTFTSEYSGVGANLGVAPQVDLGNTFRVIAGFFIHVPLSSQDSPDQGANGSGNQGGKGSQVALTNLSTGTNYFTTDSHVEELNATGIALEMFYKPWGLSYVHYIPLGGNDPIPAFISLRKTWTWGGEEAPTPVVQKVEEKIEEAPKDEATQMPEDNH
ncbi:MAG: hypothetical protein A2X86_21640 [Bdellovibrionales bacterium GWA2_49_15]|nr:MAG: hypothetical protein A2X86_21640 [Bdellovibrionales bacterium GWA2_49_15]HAZ11570.1 hypothetical protein [Bdellovibrionales bacterium]